jgi:hypothetical protein
MAGNSGPERGQLGARRGLAASVATFFVELREDIRGAPPWQLGLLVLSVALAGLFITMVGLALTEGDGSAGDRPSVSDAPKHDSSRDTRNGEPQGGGLAPGTEDDSNRADCPEIGATGAYNNTEREWAIANCPELSSEFVAANPEPTAAEGDTSGGGPAPVNPDPGGVGGPIGLPPAAPPAAPTPVPSPTTPPQPAFGAADAIALAIGYYASAPEGHYQIDPSGCTAAGSSGLWSVSCVGRLAGCARAECVEVVNACVIQATRTVAPGVC